jgi:uncharacterized membrane protein (DUF106 family)
MSYYNKLNSDKSRFIKSNKTLTSKEFQPLNLGVVLITIWGYTRNAEGVLII